MRVVRRSRWWVAGAVPLTALLIVSGATGQPRKVRLNITVTGKGTVRLSGGRLVCQTFTVCNRTFLVAAGAKVALTAQAASEWRFAQWTHGCRGTLIVCSLRVKHAMSVGATFAPAP
jgi:Divergent InlB B-repeat domain